MADLFYLSMIIFIPLFLSIMVIVYFFGDGKGIKKRLRNSIFIHNDKGLSQQGLLWLSIIMPFIYFALFGYIAWNGHHLLLNEDGLKNFVTISGLPLAILSLSLPLSILVSRLHATSQTAEQIKMARLKNNVDLFYSHRKELFSYFAQIGEVTYLHCLNAKYKIHPRVHKKYFTGTPELGAPKYNEAMFKHIDDSLQRARYYLGAVIMNINPELTYSFYVGSISSIIYDISMELGIPEIYIEIAQKSPLVPSPTKENENRTLLTVGTTTDIVVASYRYLENFFYNLCDFAGYTYIKVEEDEKYISEGDSYKTKKVPLVIEGLHEKEIRAAASMREQLANGRYPK